MIGIFSNIVAKKRVIYSSQITGGTAPGFAPGALAFLMPGPYNSGQLGGSADVHFHSQIRLRIRRAALCLAGGPAHAQSAPVTYWTPGWLGFGGNLNAGQGANSDGNFAGFGGSDAGGFSSTRNNFSNGWFVGNERGGMGLSMNGISQAGAFGSLYSEGVQFGYNFKNAPVTVYAGF